MSFVDFPSTTPEPTIEPGMEREVLVSVHDTSMSFIDFPSTTPEFEPTTKSGILMHGRVRVHNNSFRDINPRLQSFPKNLYYALFSCN